MRIIYYTLLVIFSFFASIAIGVLLAQVAIAEAPTFTPPTEVNRDVFYRVFMTSYNPEYAQTDDSPCIGASGHDQCKLSEKDIPMIALSQDLVGRAKWKPFRYGEWVEMVSLIPQCNGLFVVVDTMNERYKFRGDIFKMDRKDNTSCHARIYKIDQQ